MEVTVLDITNPPSKPVLAIHAGTVRRQAKLEVNQPFVIPHPGTQTGTVEVSLFQQLASHVLPSDTAPEVFCDIPVRTLDGQSSKVQLRVRRGKAATAGADKVKSDDSVVATRDYLEHHQLQQRIQSLIQDVLREQPDNPYKYMAGQLKKVKDGTGATKKEAPPAKPAAAPKEAPKPSNSNLTPKPPDQPKPDHSRGSRARISSLPLADEQGGFGDQTQEDKAQKHKDREAARFSVMNLLRMPRCVVAADQSLRNSARRDAANTICGLVLTSVKEKLFAEVSPAKVRQDNRNLARLSCGMVITTAATLLSPEYHRAISAWARHLAYRSAARRVYDEDSAGRRQSLPTPIVFLHSEGGNWGSWLSSK